MRTVRFSQYGGLPNRDPLDRDPKAEILLDRDPWTETHLNRNPTGQRNPWTKTPFLDKDSLEGTWDQR